MRLALTLTSLAGKLGQQNHPIRESGQEEPSMVNSGGTGA